MTIAQYRHAENELIARLQRMCERDGGTVELGVIDDGSVNSLDDPIEKSFSSEYE